MTHVTPSPPEAVEGRGIAAPVAAVLASMALVVLDANVVNIALPTLARALDVSAATSVLVVTVYQTALVVALLPCGALGERLGHRRVFTAGVALFTVASLLCATATSLTGLLLARFAQGLGGAAIMALGVALLRFTVPPRLLGRAIGWNALVVALCSAAAPSLGALVLSVASWPWLFAVNLPIALLALLACRALPQTPTRLQPIDLGSVGLNALGFASLVLGAELLVRHPAIAAALVVVSAGSFYALVRRETQHTAPLIPLDLLKLRAFRLSAVASVYCFAGQTAGLLTLSFRLQHGLDLSPLAAGLALTPWPLAVALMAAFIGRLEDRYSSAALCTTGAALLSVGLAGAALWPAQSSAWPLGLMAGMCGVGFGLFQVPNNRSLLLSAPPERSGAAGAMQGAARLSGQTSGALLVTVLLTTTSAAAAGPTALVAGAALALAAAVTSGLRSRPATRAAVAL